MLIIAIDDRYERTVALQTMYSELGKGCQGDIRRQNRRRWLFISFEISFLRRGLFFRIVRRYRNCMRLIHGTIIPILAVVSTIGGGASAWRMVGAVPG